MKPKLVIIFILLIVIPLAILTWFGKRIASDEQRLIRERINNVLTGRLADINSGISKYVKQQERQLLRITGNIQSYSNYDLHTLSGSRPLIKQIFIREKNGKISYPHMHSYEEVRASKFFQRTKSIWDSGIRFDQKQKDGERASEPYGWYTWFWGDGIHFIFWQKIKGGKVLGVEINRIVFISELIGQLPETRQVQKKVPLSRIVLTNAKNEVIYQWGQYKPEKGQKPSAKLALTPPLEAWNLQFYVPYNSEADSFGDTTMFNLVSGLVACMITLVILALYFYRENARQINDAVQKVSFVNKVSHELKTPLTNIRMYAEFLENSVNLRDKKSRKYAGIVISESQRLSRLINNVLTFAKKQKGNLVLSMRSGIPDDTVQCVIDNFSLSLREKGIKVKLKKNARKPVIYDDDALTQILSNLVSNVEKYACTGKYLGIKTRQETGKTIIVVEDKGPGLTEKQVRNIFRPFYRVSDKLSDGVTGTGIGLAIARDLARMHGGELSVESTKSKTIFTIELSTKEEHV